MIRARALSLEHIAPFLYHRERQVVRALNWPLVEFPSTQYEGTLIRTEPVLILALYVDPYVPRIYVLAAAPTRVEVRDDELTVIRTMHINAAMQLPLYMLIKGDMCYLVDVLAGHIIELIQEGSALNEVCTFGHTSSLSQIAQMDTCLAVVHPDQHRIALYFNRQLVGYMTTSMCHPVDLAPTPWGYIVTDAHSFISMEAERREIILNPYLNHVHACAYRAASDETVIVTAKTVRVYRASDLIRTFEVPMHWHEDSYHAAVACCGDLLVVAHREHALFLYR